MCLKTWHDGGDGPYRAMIVAEDSDESVRLAYAYNRDLEKAKEEAWEQFKQQLPALRKQCVRE